MDFTKQKIIDINIEDEVKNSFIDYAMSVIVARALPDVRDGLKPVHRRILYSMLELGLSPDKGFRKSARIVGDVLGKYHPHGDQSVYDAMVRMAQDFSIRKKLVDGHGNFGSVDGDSAAALRYTEAKLSHLAMEMMADIYKETVDFKPNFDETLKEPTVLPSKYPNLLVNGASGIAVGMATNIPPHNLGEVIDGVIEVIDNPDISITELMEFIKGPDFPTAGIILGREGILRAYLTGKGKVVTRSRSEIEEMDNNKSRILITEIPYMVNKARLIEKIADLVRDKKVDGIADIRDESDRNGMRIVIETKRDVNPNIILNYLYKHTQLQDTFGINLLALVNGQPKVLNLKEIIYHYIDHQKDVLARKTQYELDRAKARAHILEGLIKALDIIDQIIVLIRASRTTQTAREGLIEQFDFSQTQAQAILDMRLQRLTGLEREKLVQENKELVNTIEYLQRILVEEELQYQIIKDELIRIKDKHGDARRSSIQAAEGEIDVSDLIDEHDIVITLTHNNYIKRIPLDTYSSQHRGGKGITGLSTRENDFVEDIFVTSTHKRLLFFTSLGRVYSHMGYQIPSGGRQARGTAVINLLNLSAGEKVQAVIPVENEYDQHCLFMATRKAWIKKTPMSDFKNIRRGGIYAIKLEEDDELIGVKVTDGDNKLLLASHDGHVVRFKEGDVRPTGRQSRGVRGMNLSKDDYLVDMAYSEDDTMALVICESGHGKKTMMNEYTVIKRGGKGVWTFNKSYGEKVAALKTVEEGEELVIINSEGIIIRVRVDDISKYSRYARGVKVMRVKEGEKVVALARIKNIDDSDIPEVKPEESEENSAVDLLDELSEQSAENNNQEEKHEEENEE